MQYLPFLFPFFLFFVRPPDRACSLEDGEKGEGEEGILAPPIQFSSVQATAREGGIACEGEGRGSTWIMSSGWVTCGNKSGERGENALSLYDCAAGGFGRLRAASGGGGGRGSNVNYVEKRGGRVPPPPSSYSPKQVDIAAAAGAAAEEEGEGGLLVQVLPSAVRFPNSSRVVLSVVRSPPPPLGKRTENFFLSHLRTIATVGRERIHANEHNYIEAVLLRTLWHFTIR